MNLHASAAPRRRLGGFTLIELMVVLTIIAIVSAVAYPSYPSHVARSKRADARGQLLMAAQFMQRFYAANDSFSITRSNDAVATVFPANLMQSPSSGAAQYTLSINTSVPGAYTLTMAPLAGTAMGSDACGSYTLTSTGVRAVVGATKTRDECWK
jgi:type IV pilus assembly protein PilE